MTPLAFALLLACSSQAPVPLPQAQRTPPAVQARMVRMAAVEGWIARPTASSDAPRPGLLLLVDRIDDDSRQQAEQAATAGAVVLCVDAQVQTDAASAYLQGMPDVAGVQTRCLRQDCGQP